MERLKLQILVFIFAVQDESWFSISSHDDLLRTRKEITEIIETMRSTYSGARISVNPTSGTKQMSIAAVLAAIDMGIEDIEFISGKRKDGVVITGQEQIAVVDGARILAEHAYNHAKILFRSGAFLAAGKILKKYRQYYDSQYRFAMMMYFRTRFNYSEALRYAEKNSKESRLLDMLKNAPIISVERLCDMLSYAEHCWRINEPEEALAVLYRATECALKIKLKEFYIDTDEKTDIDAILENPEININNELKKRIKANADNEGQVYIGLHLATELLSHTGCALIKDLYKLKKYREILLLRNTTRYGHGMRFVPAEQVKRLSDRLNECCEKDFCAFAEIRNKLKYPEEMKI